MTRVGCPPQLSGSGRRPEFCAQLPRENRRRAGAVQTASQSSVVGSYDPADPLPNICELRRRRLKCDASALKGEHYQMRQGENSDEQSKVAAVKRERSIEQFSGT